jgi:hypothetical protein
LFQQMQFNNHLGTVDQNSPHTMATGDTEIWATGEWSVTVKGQNFGPVEAKGYYEAIYVRDGDALKKRMEVWNLTPAPAPIPSPTATPKVRCDREEGLVNGHDEKRGH